MRDDLPGKRPAAWSSTFLKRNSRSEERKRRKDQTPHRNGLTGQISGNHGFCRPLMRQETVKTTHCQMMVGTVCLKRQGTTERETPATTRGSSFLDALAERGSREAQFSSILQQDLGVRILGREEEAPESSKRWKVAAPSPLGA